MYIVVSHVFVTAHFSPHSLPSSPFLLDVHTVARRGTIFYGILERFWTQRGCSVCGGGNGGEVCVYTWCIYYIRTLRYMWCYTKSALMFLSSVASSISPPPLPLSWRAVTLAFLRWRRERKTKIRWNIRVRAAFYIIYPTKVRRKNRVFSSIRSLFFAFPFPVMRQKCEFSELAWRFIELKLHVS